MDGIRVSVEGGVDGSSNWWKEGWKERGKINK